MWTSRHDMSVPSQISLPLFAPARADEEALVPVRMVNEWVYCPRLAYLEWVEGEWADTGDTAQGRRVHRRVDAERGHLPGPEEIGEELARANSVTLSSEILGIIAKMDVVEAQGARVVPVDFKKGKRPHVAAGAYEPERVQICAQGMILEDNGYTANEGVLWFAGSRERVYVRFDEELRERTRAAISELRLAASSGRRPPPLEDSPKCTRCSLAGICLPDETNFFDKGRPPRPLNPADDPALPLYVQTPGARVRKQGERLVVEADEQKVEMPLIDVSQVALLGPVGVSTPTLHALMRAEIPVSWMSSGGWLLGHTVGTGNRNVSVREAQFRVAGDERRRMSFSRELVAAKIRNSRTMLRRNWRPDRPADERERVLASMRRIADHARAAPDEPRLLGYEGEAASLYFSHFDAMLAPAGTNDLPAFEFARRTRRPPTDPVNALLSFGYSLLTRTLLTALTAVGLDPYMGLYHRPRHGRPALALDLMEPFRPIIADSCALQVINNGEVRIDDFTTNGPAWALNPAGRKALIAAYERRLDQETTHPVFGYRISMRRLLDVQSRLLARYLQGEIRAYPHYLPR